MILENQDTSCSVLTECGKFVKLRCKVQGVSAAMLRRNCVVIFLLLSYCFARPGNILNEIDDLYAGMCRIP